MKTLDDLLTMTDEEIDATPFEGFEEDAHEAVAIIKAMFIIDPEEDDNPPIESARHQAQIRTVERKRRPFRRALKAQLKAGVNAQERAALAEFDRLTKPNT